MTESNRSDFGFGSYTNEEPLEEFIAQKTAGEFTNRDFEMVTAEIPTSASELIIEQKTSAAPIPKYEISERPLHARKRR